MKNQIEIDNKILLFDFDGTIVETEILAREVIESYFQQRNSPHGGRFAELIVGKTWKLAVEEMQKEAEQIGIRLGERDELVAEFKKRYQERFHRGVNLIPGIEKWLPVFRKRARFMGIVTGSDRAEVESILGAHQIRGVFDRIWGFGDYAESKPHPSPYLTALNEIGARPDEVLVFEDSRAGMEAAHRAGLGWVQVSHETHARIPDSRSLCVIRDWNEFSIP
ncbi:MAG: HAD family phosphatase [Bdellovibrionales bacterium]|nr:HAD family phosphatase [Bdellovibrionales bacterium]